jgi:hypothetical protein
MSESGDMLGIPAEEDRRAPLDEPQVLALSVAEEAGTLPAEDRRAEAVAVSVDAASGIIATTGILPLGEKTPDLHIVKDRGDGVLIDGFGCVVIR